MQNFLSQNDFVAAFEWILRRVWRVISDVHTSRGGSKFKALKCHLLLWVQERFFWKMWICDWRHLTPYSFHWVLTKARGWSIHCILSIFRSAKCCWVRLELRNGSEQYESNNDMTFYQLNWLFVLQLQLGNSGFLFHGRSWAGNPFWYLLKTLLFVLVLRMTERCVLRYLFYKYTRSNC